MEIEGILINDDRIIYLDDLNVVVEGRYGAVCLNKFSPIGRSYMFYGEHGENELNFCRRFIPKGGTVVDVGAHQGTHTVAFSRAAGDAGTVVSLEPQRLMFQNMVGSVALNSLANVHAYNAAVGEEPGYVKIAEYDYAKRGHFSGMKISDHNEGERVPLVSLDHLLLSEVQIARLDFLKIDVEGYELKVLLGARKVIENFRPMIYHEFHEGDVSNSDILGFMDSMDYISYRHAPAGFNPDNYFGHPEDRFQGGRDHNALSLPRELLESTAPLLTSLDPIT